MKIEDLDIKHHFAPGANATSYIKETHIPAGVTLEQHKHTFDHHSVLLSGEAMLTVDGYSKRVKAPALLTIAANKKHSVKAVTDVTWLCVWATNEWTVEGIDRSLIAA